MKNRNHTIWKMYEYITAFIGWVMLFSLILSFYNAIASSIGWYTIFYEYNTWFFYTFVGSLVWIKKFDIIKYRITRDPRDEPFRKWFSFKYAQKYKPNEIIFTPNEWEHKDGISNIRTCPKCNYSQYTNVLKDKICCNIYGCKEMI